MALQRRTLLQVATGFGAGLAGCSSTQGTDGTPTETPTDSDVANPAAEDIYVVIHNQLPQAITVSVHLSTEQSVLIDDEAAIEMNEFTGFETGINEKGQFDLRVTFDDREKEVSFEVNEYDLEMGSNIIFWIDEDDIRYGVED